MTTLAKWSVADYHQMIAAGILEDRRVEMIEGEIVEMSPEGPLHRYVIVEVVKYLRKLLEGMAEVYEAHPVTLSNSEPEPDIAMVKMPAIQYKERHPHPEDIYWLVEIADRSLVYDLEKKKQVYAQNKIQEYWVVDVQKKQITVFRDPQENDYQDKEEFTQGIIVPVALSSINVSVSKILACI